MSAAEENGVGGTPGQAVDGGRQRVDRDTTVTDDDVQQASAAPPWQRATSTVRTAAATPADSADLEYRTYGSDGYLDDAQHDLASHVAGDEPTQVVEHATNGVPNRGSTSVAVESPAEQTSTLRPVVDRPAAGRLFGDGSARTSVNVAAASASGSGGSGADSAGTTSAVGVPVEERKRDTPTALRRPGRGPRRASLQLKRIDPWSVLKLSFVLSVALFFVWMVAVGVIYGVLDGMGVWDRLNGTYTDFFSQSGSSPAPLISVGRVFTIAGIVGVINIVLITALATVGAFVYNVSADLVGGLEVTLAERE